MAKTNRALKNLLSLFKSQPKLPDMISAEPCPDETLLANYFEGGCSPKVEKSIQSHLADCVICRETAIACVMSLVPETMDELLSSRINPSDVLENELRAMEASLNLPNSVRQHKASAARIMVVDDDPIYLRSLTDTLSDEFDVTACTDGKSALSNARNRHFCTIVLDIKMAGMDGLEVARQLKANLVSTPIIFNTGFPGEFFKEDIEMHYCPFGYVTKDNPAELLYLVRQAASPQTLS